jgi:putative transcriptional regulator
MKERPPSIRRFWTAGFIIAAVLSAVSLFAAEAPPAESPLQPGVFLFAAPGLNDPNFFHAVVFLIDYGPEGAMGVILNRPTGIALEKVLPDLEGVERMKKPLFFGGPVHANVVLALLKSDRPLEGAEKVVDRVYFTMNRKTLLSAVQGLDPDRSIRIYSGYSGWAPGQLEFEFERGDWVVTDADWKAVFSDEPDEVWPALLGPSSKKRIRAAGPDSSRNPFLPGIASPRPAA